MKKKAMRAFVCLLVAGILVNTLVLQAPPVSAALQPFNFLGTVTGIGAETIEIKAEFESKGLDRNWVELPVVQTVDGVAPEDAVDGLKVGDYVEAASLGVAGERWVALGKMVAAGRRVITDIYGDPAHLISKTLLGDCKVEYENTADCGKCYGCNCDAQYTEVTITDGIPEVPTKLYPGGSYTYEGEDYDIDILFYSGQAWVYPACSSEPCFGPQSVSNFTIHVHEAGINLCIVGGVLLVIIVVILLIYWFTKRKKAEP